MDPFIMMDGLDCLNNFYLSTQQVWRSMYDLHIQPIKKTLGIDVLDCSTCLTKYVDYAKKIRNNQIDLPDWFLLSDSIPKIIPIYCTGIDMMPIYLIDRMVRGKSMIVFHMSESMSRNGMHVTDMVTRNLFKIFSNMNGLMYIRTFGTSPEKTFFIKDHQIATFQHLKYGLLEKKLKRIITTTPRQIEMMVRILRDFRSELVDCLMLVDLARGKYIQEVLYDDKYYDMTRIFEKLWPELELIVLANYGGMRVGAERIRRYTGNIKIYSPVYSIVETTIGYDVLCENSYTVDPTKAYFEFIDQSDKNKSIRSLEIGKLYNLVVTTTQSNICRYVTDEIVRVDGYCNGSPKIIPICKTYELLKIDDRSISPYDVELILMRCFNLVDYCYRKNGNNGIKLYVEIDSSDYLKDATTIYDVKQHVKDNQILGQFEHLNIIPEIRIVGSGLFNSLYQNYYDPNIDPSTVQINRLIERKDDIDIISKTIIYLYPLVCIKK